MGELEAREVWEDCSARRGQRAVWTKAPAARRPPHGNEPGGGREGDDAV